VIIASMEIKGIPRIFPVLGMILYGKKMEMILLILGVDLVYM